MPITSARSPDDRVWTHVRLHIYPDGGVARLRVYGQVHCDWSAQDKGKLVDLAALENGGRAIACNNQHYGSPQNLLAPGRGRQYGRWLGNAPAPRAGP